MFRGPDPESKPGDGAGPGEEAEFAAGGAGVGAEPSATTVSQSFV